MIACLRVTESTASILCGCICLNPLCTLTAITWCDEATRRSPLLQFLKVEREGKLWSSTQGSHLFCPLALINLGPKRVDWLHRRHHPRASIDCAVFPFRFVKNALAPLSQPHWTSRSPSTAPPSEQDTHYLFVTPSLEGEEHKSIEPVCK